MKGSATKLSLSQARQRLVELLQDIRFGRLEGLEVREGEPVLDPSPRVLRLFVLGKDNAPLPARGASDFALKDQVVEMLAVFDRARSLTVNELVVANGLPVQMTVMDGARA